MAVRRESVRIDVDSNMSSVLTRDAAAVALLRRELDRTNNHPFFQSSGGNLVQVNRNAQQASQGLAQFGRQADTTGSSINQLTGRLGLFADAALILGPGLVPIAAVGSQAIGGLAVALGGVVATGAAAALALNGVGDATKAIDAFQKDRTPENLAKAREEFERLGPAAQNFVLEFQKAQPLLTQLRNDVADAFLPGLTASLNDLSVVLPKVSGILEKAGAAGGGVVEDAMSALAGGRFDDFFAFAEVELPRAMQSLARTMGDIAHGASEMFMALDPGNDRFLAWLEDVGAGFDRWASSAEGRESVQAFLEYARENGPQVAELFSSLLGALSAIVEAAAPLGGPTLEALSAIAKVVETIADSDLATPLLTAAIAMRVYSRATAAAALVQQRFVRTATGPALTAANRNTLAGINNPALAGALVAPRPQDVRAARMGQIGRGVGLAAGIGLISSGVTDNINKTNTAMLTLAGTMAGPYGAAAGFVTGSLLDMQAAARDAETQMQAFNTTLSSGSATLPQLGQAAEQQRQILNDYIGSVDSFGGAVKTFGKDPMAFYDLLDGSSDRMLGYAKSATEADDVTKTLATTFLRIGESLGGPRTTLADVLNPDLDKAQVVMERVQPALDRLGVSVEDIANMKPADLQTFIGQVVDLAEASERPTSPVRDLAQAIGGANAEIKDTAKSADTLRTALDALLSPNMNLTAANDAWTTSLRTLNDDLAKNKTLVGDSNAAIQNRAAIQDRITALTDKLVAQAGKGGRGATREALADTLREGRNELIKLGDQLGVSSDEMNSFLRNQGLSWRAVNEVVRQNAQTARQETKKVADAYEAMPTAVQTYLTTSGIPETVAQVDRLVDKYGLTEEQRTALISLRDLASGRAGQINGLLDRVARDRSATITVRVSAPKLAQIESRFPAGRADGGTIGRADGGTTVPKTGKPYADRHLYLLADGEEVISNRYGQADRHRSLLKAINAGRLAEGGTAGGDRTLKALEKASAAAAKALEKLSDRLEKATSRLSEARGLREQAGGTLAQANLFGGGLSGFDLGLAANTNDTRAGTYALRRLKAKGLDGDSALFKLLAQSGDLGTLREFSNLSRSEINKRERRYAIYGSAANALGEQSVIAEFGKSTGRIADDVRGLRRELRKARRDKAAADRRVREQQARQARSASRKKATR